MAETTKVKELKEAIELLTIVAKEAVEAGRWGLTTRLASVMHTLTEITTIANQSMIRKGGK